MEAAYYFVPHLRDQVLDFFQEAIDQGLGEGRRSTPQNSYAPPIPSRACNEIRSIHDIRTLQDCLIFFTLPEILSELDGSLERVRKRQGSKEDHEAYSKEIDKKLQRKSFQHHPDRVSNRGGTPDELLEAQKAQTAINTTRTVLSVLNEEFLGDLDIDHKYKFYAKLELNSLGNEEEIRKHIKHVLHKTVWLSEIKQVHIIAQIRMFLSESQLSLQSYNERNLPLFKKHRDYAFYHLNKCIDGYHKLLTEFKIISEECRKENLGDIGSVIKKMKMKSIKESQTLKSLMDVAKLSLAGQFQLFNQCTKVDDYLVLPFVYYVNAMLMCSLMKSKKHKNHFNIMSYRSTYDKYIPLHGIDTLETLFNVTTKLAYTLYEKYHSKPSNILDENSLKEEEIRTVFNNFMINIKEELGNRFKCDTYVEGGNRNFISSQYSNFMTIAKDIDKEVINLFEDVKNSKTTNKEIQKKYEHAMKLSCGFENNIEESLEQSKVLHEEVSKVCMKSLPRVRNEEIGVMNGSDDVERLIAECLDQSKMLHEEVSKILNRKSQETVENGLICGGIANDSDAIEGIEQSDLLHEQVSLAVQKGENGTESERNCNVDVRVEIGRNVENESLSLTDSDESRITDKRLVDRKRSSNQESYSMVVTEEKLLRKQQNTNSMVESMEVNIKTHECIDENNTGQCKFHTKHFIYEKPKEITPFCSFEVVQKPDNKVLKLIEVGDPLGNESFIKIPVTKQKINDGISILTGDTLKLHEGENKLVDAYKHNPVSAGQCYSDQMTDEKSTSFENDATEISNKGEEYLKDCQTTDKNFVDGRTDPIDVRCSMAVAEQKPLPDQVKLHNTNVMEESMEVDRKTDESSDGKNSFQAEFQTERSSTKAPNETSFFSFEVVEKSDNDEQKLLNGILTC